MFQLYSKSCAYAIRALLHVPFDKRVSMQTVCRRAKLPVAYTRKVFQALAQGGFLLASTGPKGGYQLARHPKNISLLEIIKTIEGQQVFDHCVSGLPSCADDQPCPAHPTWLKLRNQMISTLNKKKLSDLIEKKNKGDS